MSLTNASPLEAAKAARLASRKLAILPTEARNHALEAIHSALSAAKDEVLAANGKDMAAAAKAAENGELSQSLVKRLDLSRKGKYEEMLQGILDVRNLEDPVGKIDRRTLLDHGLVLERKSCPIGVLLIIFEARPEVIANIAALAIKSGNSAILKGGKESTESFKAISSVICKALEDTEVPNAAIQLVLTRDAIAPLLQLDQYIDLVIPRGGNELVRSVKRSTQIPVLGHADGLCSIYLRADCPPDMATRVIMDAKLGYPAACNAVETLLVDEDALSTLLPTVARSLFAHGVTLRCDPPSKAALSSALTDSDVDAGLLQDASDADYSTEFLDLVLAVKTVPRTTTHAAVDLAVAHINAHSSHHTDAVLTRDPAAAARFLAGVDSAGVFWNASTRMADGQRFGLGTEVGISTSKIHARGPVGLEGLCIYKWLLEGAGHVAADYGAPAGRPWMHRSLPVGDVERYAADEEELEALREFRARRAAAGTVDGGGALMRGGG